MQIDQSKLLGVLYEKTTQKLTQVNNQVILLEAQLQLALEANQQLQAEIEKSKKKKEKPSEEFSTPQ